jgi:surface protein
LKDFTVMENRVVVEAPVRGVFTRLGLLFRKFGDAYVPEDDVGFNLQEALQDIRDACSAGSLPDLEMDVFDIMVEDMIAHARQQAQCREYDGRLTECDLAVILLYTCEFPDANSLYAVMNRKLNIPDRNLVKPFVKYIWLLLRALTKCPTSQYRMVYRGIRNVDLTSYYPDGHEFEWHQFSSCSCSLAVQNHFTGQTGVRTLFAIELTSSRGRDVGSYSAIQREKEVLLPPNSKFKVTSTFDAGHGLKMIQVIEIPPDDPVVVFKEEATGISSPTSVVQSPTKAAFCLTGFPVSEKVVLSISKRAVLMALVAVTVGLAFVNRLALSSPYSPYDFLDESTIMRKWMPQWTENDISYKQEITAKYFIPAHDSVEILGIGHANCVVDGKCAADDITAVNIDVSIAGSASAATGDSFIRFSAIDAVDGQIIGGDEMNDIKTDGARAEGNHVSAEMVEGVPSVSSALPELPVRDSEVQASADEQHDIDSEPLAAFPAVLIHINRSTVTEDLLGTDDDNAGKSNINSVVGLMLARFADYMAALTCIIWRSFIFADDDSWWGYYVLAIGLYILKMIVFPPSFNNESLKEAVKMWCEDKPAAVAEFGDISTWNTSQVTSMRELFEYQRNFNDPIGSWDVSNVTDMYCMFSHAVSFNQPLDTWDVSSVVNMDYMFCRAAAFNQSLDSWACRRSVKRTDMLQGTAVFKRLGVMEGGNKKFCVVS